MIVIESLANVYLVNIDGGGVSAAAVNSHTSGWLTVGRMSGRPRPEVGSKS